MGNIVAPIDEDSFDASVDEDAVENELHNNVASNFEHDTDYNEDNGENHIDPRNESGSVAASADDAEAVMNINIEEYNFLKTKLELQTLELIDRQNKIHQLEQVIADNEIVMNNLLSQKFNVHSQVSDTILDRPIVSISEEVALKSECSSTDSSTTSDKIYLRDLKFAEIIQDIVSKTKTIPLKYDTKESSMLTTIDENSAEFQYSNELKQSVAEATVRINAIVAAYECQNEKLTLIEESLDKLKNVLYDGNLESKSVSAVDRQVRIICSRFVLCSVIIYIIRDVFRTSLMML